MRICLVMISLLALAGIAFTPRVPGLPRSLFSQSPNGS
jgi:hypothetical protein